MENKRVLILYAPLGAGHGTAADAIAEAFALKYPNIEVKKASVLDFTFGIFRHGLPKAFIYANSKIPFLYGWIYRYYNKKSRLGTLNSISDTMLKGSSFMDFVKSFNPDFIISTNPLPMQLVSKSKEKNIISILSANVCTDYGFHSLWHNEDVNYYFVANEDIKKSLVEHGVLEDAIIVSGIPIRQKFKQHANRQEILKKMGFDVLRPTALVVGGKLSYRNLLKIIKGVEEKVKSAQFIVVAGRDEKLKKQLDNSPFFKGKNNVKVFGFIDNLQDYMASADLILTKAGGLTVSECLAKGLPMVITDIILGQEEDNVKYAVTQGFGVEEKNKNKIAGTVASLLLNAGKLQEMKNVCLKLAKPNAAEDIADFVALKISQNQK